MRVKSGTDSRRGQSLVELALLLPILITLLLGMVEVVNIGRTYLALLDTSYQGAHLGSQGEVRYNNAKIDTLVTQDLTNKGFNDPSNLVDVIITRADLTGGTGITNYSAVSMRSPGTSTVLTSGALTARLQSGDPAGGYLVAVEIVYNYRLLFPWPKIKGLLQDPFPLRAYTIQYSPRP
jgi:Flp pilus assembly protein TadG